MSKNLFTAFLLAAPIALATASCASLLDVDFGAAKLGPDASTTDAGCQATTCQAQGFECGTQNDTCGEALECGTCKTGVCKSGKCACVPKTCPDLKAQCGKLDDGCGGVLDCGTCVNPSDACDGTTNSCACKPKDCKAQGAECGSVPDGCGNQYACGTCANNPNGPNCTAGKCGQAACVPKTCLGEKKNCGQISDGCGKVLDCGGACTLPQTCGGAGVANVCGCTPKTCLQLGKNCGSVADGCGGTLNCGTCVLPQTCSGGGTANVCGCTPTGACKPGTNCGTIPDGCGGNISCGPPCTSPNTCGGGGVPYTCGCTPKTCLDFICGINPDGCGGSLNCGLCGGGGCFIASTPILMADGTSRAIASIHLGDVVLAADPVTGQPAPRAVSGIAIHGPEDSANGLVVINGSIHSTRNHPFWVDGQSVRADQLHVGQMLRVVSVEGTRVHSVAVTSVAIEPGSVTTYDLKFREPAGYFVGDTHTLAQPKQ